MKKNSVIEFPVASFLDVNEIIRITFSKPGHKPIFLLLGFS